MNKFFMYMSGLLIFHGKKIKISRDFQGQILRKSADFTGNFGGKLHQETIIKKQPISLDFFGKFH